jgi:hypothetical protein
MADALKQIVDHAHAVETHAEQLATLLAGQGATDAAKAFTQCAKIAHQVVQQVPAAPGKEAPPEAEGSAEPGDSPAEDQAEPAAPEGGQRTPYGAAAQETQAEVVRKQPRR